ncbi:MAG: type II toxin-antitoxin system RelE/ParE family toxin [Alphaproteobacteria bacterium]|nr:type II toxin-antitoxin system RelE/ParE family toxin [Alphaproteobacteria bacterium]
MIYDYIAEDSPQHASKTILSIEAKCSFLAEHPHLKSQQLQLHNLCKSKIGYCIIFCKPIKKGVEIARILHGARNLPKILETSF